jgi:hypothetical protein
VAGIRDHPEPTPDSGVEAHHTVAALSVAVVAAALVTAPTAVALNGLALTPPMGFNDWNAVGCGVSEAFIKQTGGIAGTAAYVHGLGLKLGLYNDSGTMTCSSHGKQGVQIMSKNGLRVLAKPLAGGDVAVALSTSSGSLVPAATS